MNEDELRQRASAVKREFPETQAAFDRVRQAARDNLFKTKPNEVEKREEIYRLVNLLDAIQQELLDAMGQGSEAIEDYVKKYNAENQATTGNR